MSEIWNKLNWKAHRPVLVVDAPASFHAELDALRARTEVHETAAPGVHYPFVLAFTPMRADFERVAPDLLRAATADAIFWFASPKQTSKAFKSDLNRDKLFAAATPHGLQPNRNIAIDDDWSALRFKRVR